MGIENQTLVHFRHFRHFSSLLTIFPSTLVERTLQIAPFMQNKPNFRKSQVNVSDLITVGYGKMDTWSGGKNKANSKPIQTQYKANTNPIQTQFKPNSNPIQTQFKPKTNPKQTQNKPNTKPIQTQTNPIRTQSCPPSVWRDKPGVSLSSFCFSFFFAIFLLTIFASASKIFAMRIQLFLTLIQSRNVANINSHLR